MTYFQSWQTIDFPLTSPCTFLVTINGEVAFRGRGVLAPSGNTRIDISDIVADYFATPIPSYGSPLAPDMWVSADMYAPCTLTASVVVTNEDTGNILLEGVVYYNYTYGREPSLAGGIVPRGGVAVRTFRDHIVPVDITIEGPSGVLATYDANVERCVDFTVSVPLSEFPDAVAVVIEGERYRVKECVTAALYYVDANGGLCIFPLVSVKDKADIERKTFSKAYRRDAVPSLGAGVENYRNDIVRRYECGSDWLSEAQMRTLYHLTESRDVWLWSGGLFIPVVLTNTTSEAPTNKTNDYKPYRLTIEAKEARSERR